MHQLGLLPGRPTTGAILSAIQEWHLELERGAEILAVFFDLQKPLIVLSYHYLGVVITDNLSWSDNINSICTNARKELGIHLHAMPNTLKF